MAVFLYTLLQAWSNIVQEASTSIVYHYLLSSLPVPTFERSQCSFYNEEMETEMKY